MPSLQMEDVSLGTPLIQPSPEGSHPELLSLTSSCGEHRLIEQGIRESAVRVGRRVWVRTEPGKVRKGEAVGQH